MNVCAIKERVLLITVAIVLAHMQEALEDNNLISIQERIQSISAADAQNSSSINSDIGTAKTPTANGSNKTVVIANS